MKFAQELEAKTLPRFRGHALKYRELKKAIKDLCHRVASSVPAAAGAAKKGKMELTDAQASAGSQLFAAQLQAELLRLDSYCCGLQAQIVSERQALIRARNTGRTDARELVMRERELWHMSSELREFIELNYTGVYKAAKKWDKTAGARTLDTVLWVVDQMPFLKILDPAAGAAGVAPISASAAAAAAASTPAGGAGFGLGAAADLGAAPDGSSGGGSVGDGGSAGGGSIHSGGAAAADVAGEHTLGAAGDRAPLGSAGADGDGDGDVRSDKEQAGSDSSDEGSVDSTAEVRGLGSDASPVPFADGEADGGDHDDSGLDRAHGRSDGDVAPSREGGRGRGKGRGRGSLEAAGAGLTIDSVSVGVGSGKRRTAASASVPAAFPSELAVGGRVDSTGSVDSNSLSHAGASITAAAGDVDSRDTNSNSPDGAGVAVGRSGGAISPATSAGDASPSASSPVLSGLASGSTIAAAPSAAAMRVPRSGPDAAGRVGAAGARATGAAASPDLRRAAMLMRAAATAAAAGGSPPGLAGAAGSFPLSSAAATGGRSPSDGGPLSSSDSSSASAFAASSASLAPGAADPLAASSAAAAAASAAAGSSFNPMLRVGSATFSGGMIVPLASGAAAAFASSSSGFGGRNAGSAGAAPDAPDAAEASPGEATDFSRNAAALFGAGMFPAAAAGAGAGAAGGSSSTGWSPASASTGANGSPLLRGIPALATATGSTSTSAAAAAAAAAKSIPAINFDTFTAGNIAKLLAVALEDVPTPSMPQRISAGGGDVDQDVDAAGGGSHDHADAAKGAAGASGGAHANTSSSDAASGGSSSAGGLHIRVPSTAAVSAHGAAVAAAAGAAAGGAESTVRGVRKQGSRRGTSDSAADLTLLQPEFGRGAMSARAHPGGGDGDDVSPADPGSAPPHLTLPATGTSSEAVAAAARSIAGTSDASYTSAVAAGSNLSAGSAGGSAADAGAAGVPAHGFGGGGGDDSRSEADVARGLVERLSSAARDYATSSTARRRLADVFPGGGISRAGSAVGIAPASSAGGSTGSFVPAAVSAPAAAAPHEGAEAAARSSAPHNQVEHVASNSVATNGAAPVVQALPAQQAQQHSHQQGQQQRGTPPLHAAAPGRNAAAGASSGVAVGIGSLPSSAGPSPLLTPSAGPTGAASGTGAPPSSSASAHMTAAARAEVRELGSSFRASLKASHALANAALDIVMPELAGGGAASEAEKNKRLARFNVHIMASQARFRKAAEARLPLEGLRSVALACKLELFRLLLVALAQELDHTAPEGAAALEHVTSGFYQLFGSLMSGAVGFGGAGAGGVGGGFGTPVPGGSTSYAAAAAGAGAGAGGGSSWSVGGPLSGVQEASSSSSSRLGRRVALMQGLRSGPAHPATAPRSTGHVSRTQFQQPQQQQQQQLGPQQRERDAVQRANSLKSRPVSLPMSAANAGAAGSATPGPRLAGFGMPGPSDDATGATSVGGRSAIGITSASTCTFDSASAVSGGPGSGSFTVGPSTLGAAGGLLSSAKALGDNIRGLLSGPKPSFFNALPGIAAGRPWLATAADGQAAAPSLSSTAPAGALAAGDGLGSRASRVPTGPTDVRRQRSASEGRGADVSSSGDERSDRERERMGDRDRPRDRSDTGTGGGSRRSLHVTREGAAVPPGSGGPRASIAANAYASASPSTRGRSLANAQQTQALPHPLTGAVPASVVRLLQPGVGTPAAVGAEVMPGGLAPLGAASLPFARVSSTNSTFIIGADLGSATDLQATQAQQLQHFQHVQQAGSSSMQQQVQFALPAPSLSKQSSSGASRSSVALRGPSEGSLKPRPATGSSGVPASSSGAGANVNSRDRDFSFSFDQPDSLGLAISMGMSGDSALPAVNAAAAAASSSGGIPSVPPGLRHASSGSALQGAPGPGPGRGRGSSSVRLAPSFSASSLPAAQHQGGEGAGARASRGSTTLTRSRTISSAVDRSGSGLAPAPGLSSSTSLGGLGTVYEGNGSGNNGGTARYASAMGRGARSRDHSRGGNSRDAAPDALAVARRPVPSPSGMWAFSCTRISAAVRAEWQATWPKWRTALGIAVGVLEDENAPPTLAASAAAASAGGDGSGSGGSGKKSVGRLLWERWRPPIAQWLPDYNWRRNLSKDVVAGITIGVLLIPQGLAYATLAGLPPVYGVYTGFPSFIYAILGTSRHAAVGPMSLPALLMATAVSELGSSVASPEEYLGQIMALTFLAGLLLLVMGLLNLGFIVRFISTPVLSGFTSAAAIMTMVSVTKDLIGAPVPRSQVLQGYLEGIAKNLPATHLGTLVTSVFALVALWGLPKVKRFAKVPAALIVVVAAVVFFAVWMAALGDSGVAVTTGGAASTTNIPAGFLPSNATNATSAGARSLAAVQGVDVVAAVAGAAADARHWLSRTLASSASSLAAAVGSAAGGNSTGTGAAAAAAAAPASGAAASSVSYYTRQGIALVGKVPSAFPVPSIPPLNKLTELLPAAVSIAFVGYIESIAVAKVRHLHLRKQLMLTAGLPP